MHFTTSSEVSDTGPYGSLVFRTLHKQGPYGGKPVAKRTLIVTPGSLVKVGSE